MNPTSDASPFERLIQDASRRQLLDQAMERVSRVVDGLGNPVDPGIAQAVAALSAMDVNTSQSCEGHVDWGTGGPYIDIGSPAYRKMKAESDQALSEGAISEEQHRAARDSIRLDNLAEGQKILPILDSFYASRIVPFETRLALSIFGPGMCRLQSAGVAFIDLDAAPESRLRKLQAYQAEMGAFTDFMLKFAPIAPLAPREKHLLAALAQKRAAANAPAASPSAAQPAA